MNKFLTLFVFALFAGQTYAGNLRSNYGDLSPTHRRLSEAGQLNLKIDGRGYFMYRLRVKGTDASADASQANAGTATVYGQAYRGQTEIAVDDAVSAAAAGSGTIPIADTTMALTKGQKVALTGASCANTGTFTVKADVASGAQSTIDVNEAVLVDANAAANCKVILDPPPNAGANAGEKDGANGDSATAANNVEDAADGDADHFSQVIYSRDGSMHVNKYGYLCDDNGLLLVSTGKSADANAKFHIHIPSRAESILVTPSGKVLAEELGGSVFTDVGQLKLARFENPQGLNVRLHMKSNCAAANEDGFALGNWCVGTALDGKDHVYMSETAVSGPGIVGKPGDQGLGRIVV
jgi:hypothetical protein